jgi:hypothetical protein
MSTLDCFESKITMLEFWYENNKLYTKLDYLREWEDNKKTITRLNIDNTKNLRTNYLGLSTLLVQPMASDSGIYLLVIGGNTRTISDRELGVDKEPIELIDFKQLEDGRWYVLDNIKQLEDGSFTGTIRTDLKNFATLKEARTTYSFLHNAKVSGYDRDEVVAMLDDPELGELNLNEQFVQVGDPKSLGDWFDKSFPQASEEENLPVVDHPYLQGNDELVSETLATPSEPLPSTSAIEQTEERLVLCPSCGDIFDPSKHKYVKPPTQD